MAHPQPDPQEELERLRERVAQLEAERRVLAPPDMAARLIAVCESTIDLVSTATVEGVLTYMNAAGCRLLGWKENSDWSQYRIADVHPQWAGEYIRDVALPNAMREGIWTGDTAILHASGDEIPVSQVIMVHRGPNGEVAFMSTIMRDISPRKEMEEDLRQSRGMLQLVLDTIPQFVFWKDRDSIYMGCNRNFARVAGLENTADIVGKSDYELVWKKEESDFFRECDRRVMDGNTAEYHIIEPQLQADGTEAWLDTTKVPIHDARGEVIGILGTFEDITQRKQAEKAIAESEENLRITLDSIGDAVIATDSQGLVARMNPVAQELTGWTQADAKGKLLSDIFQLEHGDTGERMDNPVEEIVRTGSILGLAPDAVLVARDGHRRQIADSAAPIRDKDGKILGVVLVFHDVTGQRELEEQLRQSQKLESIGQLAGGVAHDFNNMLTGIMGSAELLRPILEGEHARLLLDTVLSSAGRAASLTQKLLDFARKGTATSMLVNIHTVLEDVRDLLERSIDKRIHLSTSLKATLTTVLGDPVQLQNAILNLGLNARDSISGAGEIILGSIDVTFDEEYCSRVPGKLRPGPYIELSVADTGSGMTREVLEHIFEPFFTTKAVGKGTGLGLASVYSAVRDHHGEVHAYSEPDIGTVIKLYLPVQTSGATRSDEPAGKVLPGTGRILVVDDEPIVLQIATDLLQSIGYEVVAAEDGQAALEIFEREYESIDLVLLDLIMPQMGGRDAYRAMREIDPDVRALYSSGFTGEDRIDTVDEGILGFIKKPYRLTEIARAVAVAIASPRRG